MANPAVVKAAITAATDPKILKIIGGIILGLIIVIIAPIAVILGASEQLQSIDFDSPEIRQQITENMSPEEKAKLQELENTLLAIEGEINAQGLNIDPTKAQIIYMFTLGGRENDENFYTYYIGCFAGAQSDDVIFNNIEAKFGVSISAEDRKKILEICGKAAEGEVISPKAIHKTIGDMCAANNFAPTEGLFSSPFHGRDWRSCVTSGFGSRKHPITGKVRNHTGVDLAAGTGTKIYAAKPGKVLFVGWDESGYGNYIVLNHGGGEATLYGHCSKILARAGDIVTADTAIAEVGSTGGSTGPHLHFEVILSGQPVNPVKYLEVSN